MTPENQRVAIAEVCGWTQIEDISNNIMMDLGTVVVGYPPHIPIIGKKQEIPSYLTDLNAAHDFENWLKDPSHFGPNEWLLYVSMLQQRLFTDAIHATAAQRAETFLKTIGKWEE